MTTDTNNNGDSDDHDHEPSFEELVIDQLHHIRVSIEGTEGALGRIFGRLAEIERDRLTLRRTVERVDKIERYLKMGRQTDVVPPRKDDGDGDEDDVPTKP